MKKRRLSRDILVLVILSLIAVMTWIALDIHRIVFKEEGVYVPPEQMEALNPEIDQEIIDKITEGSLFKKEEYLPPEKISEEETTGEVEGVE